MTSHRLAFAATAPLVPNGPEIPRVAEQLVSLLAPSSFEADQYRALRHVVERLRRESGFHVLAVTSPGPGDGKTVTTLNLAGALAQSAGARILVIDADLRKPSVGDYLGLNLRLPGLANAIADPDYELASVARQLEGFNLSVVPAGKSHIAPYELLNSPRLEGLLREARLQYDFVLVDTPPFVGLPDGRLIERGVDGFLVVVSAHRTPRKMLAEALNTIDPAKVVGVVFNGDDRPTSEYYGYGYGGYHGARSHGASRSWWQGLSWWRRLMNGRRQSAAR
jgi:capsular exopolysaccharide synthesis family protein